LPERRFDHRDRSEEVRREQLPHVGVVAFLDRRAVAVAGVVDQHVAAAEPSMACSTAAVTWAASVTSRTTAGAVRGWLSARARPRPLEQPVINQVVM
jgi:hypothetical protein